MIPHGSYTRFKRILAVMTILLANSEFIRVFSLKTGSHMITIFRRMREKLIASGSVAK